MRSGRAETPYPACPPCDVSGTGPLRETLLAARSSDAHRASRLVSPSLRTKRVRSPGTDTPGGTERPPGGPEARGTGAVHGGAEHHRAFHRAAARAVRRSPSSLSSSGQSVDLQSTNGPFAGCVAYPVVERWSGPIAWDDRIARHSAFRWSASGRARCAIGQGGGTDERGPATCSTSATDGARFCPFEASALAPCSIRLKSRSRRHPQRPGP